MDTKKFTYEEAVAWLVTLSKISDCEGLADCAETYAQRLVVDEERKQGWMWLEEPPEFWGFMKSVHYKVLERSGFDRGIFQLPLLSTPTAGRPASSSVVITPGEVSYGGSSLPTPPVATGASGIPAAYAGFTLRRPPEVPVVEASQPPMSTVTAGTAGSEIAEAFLVGMNTFTAQLQESVKSQLIITENDRLDKPVPGILELQPEMGYKLTVNAFLAWLKSVEEAWGKVSATVTQVIAKLR